MKHTVELKRAQDYTADQKQILFDRFPVAKTYHDLVGKKASTLAEQLRQSKAQDFINVAFAEYFRQDLTSAICLYWSQMAEARLSQAFNKATTPDGLAVFAYGKLGSGELNLSSDVDLVVIAESGHETTAIPALREFRTLIADQTDFGFCHRVDFDLRAGGRMGPLVATFEQWQDYFANFGEAWERLSFIRFRPIWGDPQLQDKVRKEADRLTFRKYLDFSLIEELKDLRRKIHEQNWMRSEGEVIDLKLGVGGIRDLELYTHTLQVIYGGKSPIVRTPSTSLALEKLESVGALSKKDRQFMESHYWNLRHVENLVQAIGDEQTHLLNPRTTENIFNAEQISDLRQAMQECHRLVSSLLGPLDNLKRSLPENEQSQKEWLQSIGVEAAIAEKCLPALFEQEVLSRQRERDDRTKKLFIYRFLTRSQELALDLNEILPRLTDLIRKIRAKASLFHMLVNQPSLIDRLCLLLSSSGYLSQILIHRPELLDTFVLEQQSEVADSMSVEDKILHWRERRLIAELLSGLDYLNDLDVHRLSTRLSDTADSIVKEMMTDLRAEFSSQVDVIALGKWGGQEMGLGSDLDFVLIAPDLPKEGDMKLARRLLNRLTGGESIYNVDLRLKPHGSAGILLTSVSELKQFLATEAPAWQRQCYLKARSLFGTTPIHELFAICAQRKLSDEEIHELARIRAELVQQNLKSESIDVKYPAGGLLDIELFTQTLLIAQKCIPTSARIEDHFNDLMKVSSPEVANTLSNLRKSYFFLRSVEQVTRLREQPALIAKQMKLSPSELEQRIQLTLQTTLHSLDGLDPRVLSR